MLFPRCLTLVFSSEQIGTESILEECESTVHQIIWEAKCVATVQCFLMIKCGIWDWSESTFCCRGGHLNSFYARCVLQLCLRSHPVRFFKQCIVLDESTVGTWNKIRDWNVNLSQTISRKSFSTCILLWNDQNSSREMDNKTRYDGIIDFGVS